MAYVKNIQGLGSNGVGYLGSALPNWQVFNGSSYDSVDNYVPLDVNLPRTFLLLTKATSSNNVFWSSRQSLLAKAEERLGEKPDGHEIIFFDSSQLGIRVRTEQEYNSKVQAVCATYDGSIDASGMSAVQNGLSKYRTISNVSIASILSGNKGYIGINYPSAPDVLAGNIGILTIVNRVLTPLEITQFNADPFGFNNTLTPAECHLRVDFNRTTGQVPLDTSSFGRTISITGTSTFTQFPN